MITVQVVTWWVCDRWLCTVSVLVLPAMFGIRSDCIDPPHSRNGLSDQISYQAQTATSESQRNASPIHGTSSAGKGTELEDAPGTESKADIIN